MRMRANWGGEKEEEGELQIKGFSRENVHRKINTSVEC